MENEIREYEAQLEEIRQCIEAASDDERDELRRAEQEVSHLIAELRTKLPKFKPKDEVATKKLMGKVVEILPSKHYKVEIFNSDGTPTGDFKILNEDDIWKKQLPKPQTAAVLDEFEINKNRWNAFKQGTKGRICKSHISTKFNKPYTPVKTSKYKSTIDK